MADGPASTQPLGHSLFSPGQAPVARLCCAETLEVADSVRKDWGLLYRLCEPDSLQMSLDEGPLEAVTSARFSSHDSPYAHVEFPRSREIELPWEERLLSAASRRVALRRAASRLIPPEFFEPLTALGIQAHLHPAPSGPTVTTPYTPKASQHTLWALTELSLPSWKTCTPPTWTRTHPCLWSASVPIGAQKRTFPCGGAWVKGTASPITW